MGPAEIKARFPLLDPEPTVLAFVAYHVEKNDTSHNWDATFYGWCDRQRQAAEKRQGEKNTDSMGFNLSPGGSALPTGSSDYGRRFLAAYNQHIEAGLEPEAARAQATKDLEDRG
jgi:hypothetical protein